MPDDQEQQGQTNMDEQFDEVLGAKIVEYLCDRKSSCSYMEVLDIPGFGICHLNIKDAAYLIAADMWFSGDIEGVDEPENFDGSHHNPWLKIALADTITAFEARMIAAVECGRLKASAVRRDLDEKLIADKNYIDFDDLHEWLSERGYETGEIMSTWLDTELEIASHLYDELVYLRAASKQDLVEMNSMAFQGLRAKAGKIDETDATDLLVALKAMVTENQRLKDRLAQAKTTETAKVDRPVTTRARRTMLTIIAALCDKAGIDYTARGAAQRIKEATEEIGAPIDDGTIAQAISEIPDALESRAK